MVSEKAGQAVALLLPAGFIFMACHSQELVFERNAPFRALLGGHGERQIDGVEVCHRRRKAMTTVSRI
jgi:hypothetical protein